MVETTDGVGTYWDEMARFYWMTGAPLRPAREDVRHFTRLAARFVRRPSSGPLRALMLGVTPGYAGMAWPDHAELLAVDQSFAMVKGVWPGDVPGNRRAICGDWLSLPLADHSCHIVIADGSGNCVHFPEGLRRLAGEVARVLRPGGFLLLRCYAQLEQKENPACVLASLRDGASPSFHHFKFRLLMAMQESAHRGVALADVHRYWERSGIDPERLAEMMGWDLGVILAMDAYRDSPTVHVFPTLAQFRAVLGEYFGELSCSCAPYPLAERCPVLALRPIGGAR